MICDGIAGFIKKEVGPEEEALRKIYLTNPDGLDQNGRKLPEVLAARNRIFRKSAQAGFLSAHMPESVGGGGISHVDVYFVREEVFRHGLGLNQYVVAMTSRGPNLMLLKVQESVKDKYLYPVMNGEKTTCLALTEENAGSDVPAIRSKATRDGKYWVIEGSKRFIGNGPYAEFAIVVAYTAKSEKRGYGLTLFVVDLDSPGISRTMIRTTVESGDWCEIHFDKVRVPEENIIGELHKGYPLLLKWLEGERIDMGGQCIGLSQFMIEHAIDYAKDRITFGKPLASRQYIQGMIVDSLTEVYAAKMAILATAWKIDRGEKARKEVAMAKILGTETLYRVADRMIQVLGGNGIDKALPIEKIFRLARSMRIYEGTTEIHKLTIAKELGLPES
jgi:acyl-CoA dehydrogenase